MIYQKEKLKQPLPGLKLEQPSTPRLLYWPPTHRHFLPSQDSCFNSYGYYFLVFICSMLRNHTSTSTKLFADLGFKLHVRGMVQYVLPCVSSQFSIIFVGDSLLLRTEKCIHFLNTYYCTLHHTLRILLLMDIQVILLVFQLL